MPERSERGRYRSSLGGLQFMLPFIAAILAVAGFTLNAPLMGLAMRKGAHPGAVVTTRNFTASIVLTPATLLLVGPPPIMWEAAVFAAIASLFGPGLGDVLYNFSIQRIGASTAATLAYTYIFIAYTLDVLLLGAEPRMAAVVGGTLALVGIALSSGRSKGKWDARGVAYGALTAVSWGIATTSLKVATTMWSPEHIAMFRSLFLSTVLGAFYRRNLRGVSVGAALMGSISGITGLVIGALGFIYSVRDLGVTAAALITAAVPTLTPLAARAILGDPVGRGQVMGAVLTGVGIAIGVAA